MKKIPAGPFYTSELSRKQKFKLLFAWARVPDGAITMLHTLHIPRRIPISGS